MADNTPNHYVLTGSAVNISFGPDLTGQLSINYTVSGHTGTAHKQAIRQTQIDSVGTVVTFPLKPGPSADEGDPQFSFLLPKVTLDGHAEQPFDTIGFTATTARLGPAHQRYTEVALHGKANHITT